METAQNEWNQAWSDLRLELPGLGLGEHYAVCLRMLRRSAEQAAISGWQTRSPARPGIKAQLFKPEGLFGLHADYISVPQRLVLLLETIAVLGETSQEQREMLLLLATQSPMGVSEGAATELTYANPSR